MTQIPNSKQNKKCYELTYIIPDKFPENEIPKISEKVKKLLPDGKIIKENLWGRKKLAYPIKKSDFGYYVTLVFETEPDLLSKIESKLKLEEDVIRHLIVSTKLPKKPEVKEVRKIEKPKELERPKVKVRAKPKKVEKPKKPKIEEEIETEEKKMKALEEKLEEILKE